MRKWVYIAYCSCPVSANRMSSMISSSSCLKVASSTAGAIFSTSLSSGRMRAGSCSHRREF